jgi:hypothetical protein
MVRIFGTERESFHQREEKDVLLIVGQIRVNTINKPSLWRIIDQYHRDENLSENFGK